MATKRNHYIVLGVPQDARSEDIKRAYRLLSQLWHPDTNKREDASEHFIEISEAAEVLLDPIRRAEYDSELAVDGTTDTSDYSYDTAHADAEDEETKVSVEPTSIDFGTLQSGGPAVVVKVTLSWTGPAPMVVQPRPLSDAWWSCGKPGLSIDNTTFIFPLNAQAYGGMASGKQYSHIDIVVDGIAYRVKLAAQIIGAPTAPVPPGRPTYHTPPVYAAYPPYRPYPTPSSRPSPTASHLAALATAPSTPSTSEFLVRLLLLPIRLAAGAVAIAVGAAFLAAPWVIMAKTNQGNNGTGWEPVVVPAVCGIWGIANIFLALGGLALLLKLLWWIISGRWPGD